MGTGRALTIARAPKRKKRIGLFFVFPVFLYHLYIVVMPSFKTLYYSFFDWNGIGAAKYVGLANFIEMFTEDNALVQALINNLKWTLIFVTVPIAVGLLISIFVSNVRNSRLQMAYRTVIFMPYVLSSAIAGKIWATFFNPITASACV